MIWRLSIFEVHHLLTPLVFPSVLQVKQAMTATEKILANASEKTKLAPGENVWVKADVLMTHDVCGPGTIGIFKKEFGQNAKVCYLSVVVT